MELDHSPRFKDSIEHSKLICRELGGTTIQPMDIFLSTLVSNYDVIINFFNSCTSDPAFIIRSAYAHCQEIKRQKKKKICWTRESSSVINKAGAETIVDNSPFIGVEHLFASCLKNSPSVADFLQSLSIDSGEFYQAFVSFRAMMLSSSQTNAEVDYMNQTTKNISKFCDHVNTRVIDNHFQFYGRMDEINAAMTALCRKQKSNVLFVGEAGVGKTALVEGLALAMEQPPDDSDIAFVKMDIFELKLSDMLAGAIYRGEFEKRLNDTVEELKSFPSKVVVFIDEFHSIVGAGDKEGAMDAANILKPALARGEISCIGATTFAEYKKYIEKDTALARRFEVIKVTEPSAKETAEILQNCKTSYEKFHGVKFSPDSIKLLVKAADEHTPYRKFPDKAFDLLDEAGTFFKLKHCRKPINLVKRERVLRKKTEEDIVTDETHLDLLEFKADMEIWIESIKKEVNIGSSEIKQFLNKKFNISENSPDLYTLISKNLLGQADALTEFCSLAKFSSSTRLGYKNKPRFLVLIGGPSGVGKTLLAQEYAKAQPLGVEALEIFDMSHYADSTSINKMIGSSAGYIGYEQGGVLTEKLKNNPNLLILFKNIEKAHPSVIDLIAQILSNGILNDNIGQKIDCSRCSIFLTTSEIQKNIIGFNSSEVLLQINAAKLPKNILSSVDKSLVFKDLCISTMKDIVISYLSQPPLKLQVDPSIPAFVVEKVSTDSGARPVLSATDELIMGPVYKYLSQNPDKDNEKISIKMLDKSVNINILGDHGK